MGEDASQERRRCAIAVTIEQLIDRYQDLVFSVCYRMVNNYFQAQDLAQETFLAAYLALDRFDGRNEKAWLCRIAANKCTDYLRRQRMQVLPDGEEVMLALPDEAPDPERKVLEEEVQEEVRLACTALKEPYRSAALAYFVEEMSFGEIAEATGQNLKTVQTRVYRAKTLLKKKIRKEQIE